MSKPKVSVILVTYNRESFLKRSLESILYQTYENFELILVNNGSTDGTYELCKNYAQKDNRIKLINIEENHGASRGRNVGLETATADYITIVDDDDYCNKDMLDFLVSLRDKYSADIAICGSYYDLNGKIEPEYIFDELLILDKSKGLDELLKREKYNVSPPTKLFRRSLFDHIKFPEGVLVDDIHVIYKVFANANQVVAQGKPLYYFRKHESNMTSFIHTNRLTPELLKEYLSMYRQRTLYLSKKVPEITARARYSEWSYMISMCDKIKKYNCVDCGEVYDFMIKAIKENLNDVINNKFITEKEKVLLKKYVI